MTRTVAVVLQLAHARGIEIEADGPRLACWAPAGTRLDDFAALVAVCRAELHRHLADACAQCGHRATVMVGMEPGPDGLAWSLCAECWRC